MIATINPTRKRWTVELTGDDEGVPVRGRIEKLLRSARANYGLPARVLAEPIQDAADYRMPFGPHQGESLGTIFRCSVDYSDGLEHGVGLQLAQWRAIRKASKEGGEPFTAVIDALREVVEWDRDCERIWATTWRTGAIPTLPTPPEAACTVMPNGSEYTGKSVLDIRQWNLNIFFGLADGAHLAADGVDAVAAMVKYEGAHGFLSMEKPPEPPGQGDAP